MGWALAVLVIEAARRVLGWIFVGLLMFFLTYPFFCNYLPGVLHGRAYTPQRVGEFLFLQPTGLIGMPVAISGVIIIVFLLLAQLLIFTGAGKFFIDFAKSLMGSVRGGPAKAAVVASCGFGMLSGSPIGNVASTGAITIPLMKKVGYEPHFAGAVESVASLGGVFMPPIMGAVIFILCDFIEMAYIKVAIAAFIPALLYYLALFIMVDLEAAKTGMQGIPREELPSFIKTFRAGFWYFLPVALLVYLLIGPMYTPQKAAIWSIVALVALSMFQKEGRISPRKFIVVSEQTVRTLLQVTIPCAAVGIIISSVSLTGLGVNISTQLVTIAGGNLVFLLMLTALTSFVLGMGLGAIACYVFLAIMVAPSLVSMGVPLLAAHLFIFYFGMVAFITPPVCIAAYAAAGIAGSEPFRTGWQATRLGIAAYIVPFSFTLGPALLLIGSLAEIALTLITAVIGVAGLAVGVQGYLLARLNWLQRILLIGGGVVLIMPGWLHSILGFASLVVAALWHWAGSRQLHPAEVLTDQPGGE
jgi:TRAP transporter 4TM/12TM fusion protein